MQEMVNVMDRARDCLDHFGECDLEDMENLRQSLHVSRVQNLMSSSSDPTWMSSQLDQRSLEEDLERQLTLLREHIGSDEMMSDLSDVERVDAQLRGMDSDTAVGDISKLEVPPQSVDPPVDASELHMATEGGRSQVAMARGGAATVPVPVPLSDAVAPQDHARWSPWMEDIAVEGWKAFDLQSTEAIAIVATILLILLLPSTVYHGVI